MNPIIRRLLALLSAAALMMALSACQQPTTEPSGTSGAQESGAEPSSGTEAGGGPETAPSPENQPATAPETPPADDSATEPTGGGPAQQDPSGQLPATDSSELSVDERLRNSNEKIQEGLREMRDIASEQAATGEADAKRAAEDLQDRAQQAEDSIESGLEKLKQEMTPGEHP